MPIMMSVHELQPGMRLYRSLYHGDMVLLPAGKVIEQEQIDALRRRHAEAQLCVCDPILDELVEFQDQTRDQEIALRVHRRLTEVLSGVREKFQARAALRGSDLASLQDSLAEVIRYIQENPVTAALLLSSSDWHGHLQEHSANVFYISLLMGNAIRQYVRQERERQSAADRLQSRFALNLAPLATGAIFHDIGMLPIESVYGKEDPLTSEERERIRNHPLAGEAMLPKETDAVTRMVIRTHHENWQGTGYPQGVPATRLHIFSRIIRIADAYDAATSPRVYKRAKTPARALWEMVRGPYACLYDPIVLKVFAGLIQPFPIGARILLSCGQYGVVVAHNREEPFRPRIIIAFGADGRRLPPEAMVGPIDLARSNHIRMVRFGTEDLSYLNRPTVRAEDDMAGPEELFSYVYP